MTDTNLEYVGLALFVASEVIGMSKLKSNTVLQFILEAAMRAFPYELQKKEPPRQQRFSLKPPKKERR